MDHGQARETHELSHPERGSSSHCESKGSGSIAASDLAAITTITMIIIIIIIIVITIIIIIIIIPDGPMDEGLPRDA
jgi:hypothetical protein